jgi:hypothetical protein
MSKVKQGHYLLHITDRSSFLPVANVIHWASAGNSVQVSFNVPLNGLKDEPTGINEPLTTS